jgi:hypothetical protein
MVLIGPVDYLEEQFCPGFRERNIPQFIQDEQMKPLQLFLQALQLSLYPTFHQLGNNS